MRPAVIHRIADQRDSARAVLTDKEFEAWEAIAIRGLTQRAAAWNLGITHSSVRDRVASATRKLEKYSRSEFAAEPEPEPEPISHRDNDSRLAVILLIQRDGPACYLCKRETYPGKRCVEHIIPRSKGGSDDAENLALACGPCNTRKGNKYVSFLLISGRPVYHPSR
jgi:DNA-binding CsgD family transcriptional regulator